MAGYVGPGYDNKLKFSQYNNVTLFLLEWGFMNVTGMFVTISEWWRH